MRLELKPVTYRPKRHHASIVEIRVGNTVKASRSSQDGEFDLRGAKPGSYEIRIAAPVDGAWGKLEILPDSKQGGCPLKIRLDTEQNTVVVSEQ